MEKNYEFYRVTEELSDLVEYGGDLEPACEKCPFQSLCEAQELWLGCAAWECSMGDDL